MYLSVLLKEQMNVHHVQFNSWDESAQIPVTAESFITLFNEVQKLQKQRVSEAPILIQCP